MVKFKNGALATISTGCYATKGNSMDSKTIFSSKDSRAEFYIADSLKLFGYGELNLSNDDDGTPKGVYEGDGTLGAGKSGETLFKEENDYSYLCDRTFVDAVISGDGSKILSPYEDAVCSLEFTLACNRSMAIGLPVKIGSF